MFWARNSCTTFVRVDEYYASYVYNNNLSYSGTGQVVATGGDAFLGGDDYDGSLVEWALGEMGADESQNIRC